MITQLQSTECACDICKKMCDRPCWPSPEEARKLIEMGYSERLMLDYWASEKNIELICPAILTFEGQQAPFIPIGGCTFKDKEGLCMLHDKGLKPIEGRLPDHNSKIPNLHHEVARLWDNDEGRKLVKEWRNRK